ncbi:hypothetical protein FKM82_001245 [Ascaphus truei]
MQVLGTMNCKGFRALNKVRCDAGALKSLLRSLKPTMFLGKKKNQYAVYMQIRSIHLCADALVIPKTICSRW